MGLQTTAAPRRKDQKVPILETYEFVANERVVAAKPDFQDYLDCCSFAAYSSLKCLGDNAKALRIPDSLITQLSQMYKDRHQSRDIDAMLDFFPKDSKFALLDYLKRLSEGCNDPAAERCDVDDDMLLNSVFSPCHVKPAIDIVMENCVTNKLRLTELASSHGAQWYSRVLDYCDSAPTIRTDYTLWTQPDFTQEHGDARILVKQSQHDVKLVPHTADQHLVLLSHCMQVSNIAMQIHLEVVCSCCCYQ